MGSSQSVRASHFVSTEETQAASTGMRETEPMYDPDDDDDDTDNHISISNKMVERLVEDAALAGGAKAAVAMATNVVAPPRDNYKEKLFIEKLKCLDDKHSEKTGLTLEEVKATVKRIEMRTANLGTLEPICTQQMDAVLECYDTPGFSERGKCWDVIEKFSKCVQQSAAERVRARSAQEARDAVLRYRRVERVRGSTLRDLGPRPHDTPVN